MTKIMPIFDTDHLRMEMKEILKWIWIVIGATFLLLIMVLLNLNPSGRYYGSHLETSERTATVILIDGLSKRIFHDEMKAGNLPNLAAFAEEAVVVDNGIASFPTMTGYGFYPFITGMEAYESGIYGLRWYDRNRDKGNLRNYVGKSNVHMNKDITKQYKTIYEYVDTFYTSSINTYMNRGVKDAVMTSWAHTTAKYKGIGQISQIEAVPVIGSWAIYNHYQHETIVTELAIKQLKRNPKFQWITYPSLDAHAHVYGVNEEYRNLLKHIDEEVGRFIKAIKQSGNKDRMVAIVTDHGVNTISENLPMVDNAKKLIKLDFYRGEAANVHASDLNEEKSAYMDKDAYFVINGNQCAYVYMAAQDIAGGERWEKKMMGNELLQYRKGDSVYDVPRFASDIPGVDLVAYRNDSLTVGVGRKKSRALISKNADGTYNYYPRGGDPLQLGSEDVPLLKLKEEELVELSMKTHYPMSWCKR